ncbi:MAG: right-handed parallel beta-helix repeat-containing protein, partial [Armatimonadota bacterium]
VTKSIFQPNYGYSVSLTVRFSDGTTSTNTTTYTAATPSFYVSADQSNPRRLTFTAPQGDLISAYNWSFGDGANGSGRVIAHTFPDYGTYSVTLTITATNGSTLPPVTQIVRTGFTGPTYIYDSVINGNTTWHAAGSPYVVSSTLTVNSGKTLTIEPGTIVKFSYWDAAGLLVNGSLVAQGTASAPIYFTSLKDDSVGGDTNGDGNNSSPARGDWNHILITGAGASGTFDHCVVRYGGYGGYNYNAPYANLACTSGGAMTVTNCTVTQSANYGIYYDGVTSPQVLDSTIASTSSSFYGIYITNCPTPNVSRCTIASNGGGVYMSSCPTPTLNDNTFNGNSSWAAYLTGSIGTLTFSRNGGSGNGGNGLYLQNCTVAADSVWHVTNGFPYVVSSTLTVNSGKTLTIEPGTIVKFSYWDAAGLLVNGSLVAQGTASAPIYFTSLKDDSVGGDTNGDGNNSSPARGDWNHILITGAGASGTFDHCVVRYGGYGGYNYNAPYANLACTSGGAMTVTNCTVTQSANYGIYYDGAGARVKNSIVAYNGSYGVYLTGGSAQVMYCDFWSNSGNSFGTSPVLVGNITADPLFVSAAGGDYRLQGSSPCIDAGDPNMFDPDGTRADIGAIPNLGLSVAACKRRADGEQALSVRGVVTAVFGDAYYVESYSRSSGIRVEQPGHSFAPGMQVRVTGVLGTNADGERYIEATSAAQSGTGSVGPLALTNRALGGGDWLYDPATGSGQRGMPGGFGLNNIGLLVKTWGVVTRIGDGYLYIDDGSAIDDGTYTGADRNIGVRVICNPVGYNVGDYLVVTGIGSCFNIPSDRIARRILVRWPEDVRRGNAP